MQNIAIKMENVQLQYILNSERNISLKKFIINVLKGENKSKEFNALKNINLEIFKGERIGIIGNNGSGKSTLLKVISGIVKPTDGKVYTNGLIAPLLELGAGFDDDFSGEYNIYLNSAILGRSKSFIEEHFNEIIEFSELGDFIKEPIRNYSSGMRAKLGFSIATQINPDILILDEILGVGDQHFQKKSNRKITDIINSGKTVILVSHSIDQIVALTDRVVWLDNGMIKEIGPSRFICDKYIAT